MQNQIVTRTALVTSLLIATATVTSAITATTAGAQESTTWNWSGELGNGRTVHLRNVNGVVRFEQSRGIPWRSPR